MLLCKGYVGIESEVRAIIPKKKLRSGVLTGAEKLENAVFATGRIIVENCFGPQGTLWAIVVNNSRWPEGGFDSIFRMTIVITNIHIK